MALKNPRDEIINPPEVNMTPMIDIVFQLIIFFMIVIDMSQKDLEDLVLPMSKTAMEDEPEEGRLYVNINRRGEYIMTRANLSLNDLERELKVRVDLPRPEGKRIRDKDGLAERPILIRADRASEFKHVQKVMFLCGKEGLKIWKVELAAGQEKKEEDEAAK
ncbi:MAG: biopolymer transporter ExbD [Planctomycetota bacterium]